MSDTQQEPANPLPSGDCLTTIRTRPSPLFWAVIDSLTACEDLFDLVIELSMALLSMMTYLTREEPAGSRPPSREWCVRTQQQLTKANGPRQRYAAPTVRWTPSNCAWLVG